MIYTKPLSKALLVGILANTMLYKPAIAQNKDVPNINIQAHWKIKENQDLSEKPISTLILENQSSGSVNLNDWSLWFNFIRNIDTKNVDSRFEIEHRNGDLFRVTFQNKPLLLKPNDTIHIDFATSPVVNYTDGPSGLYLQSNKDGKAYDILAYDQQRTFPLTKQEKISLWTRKYQQNDLAESLAQPVIPMPAEVKVDPDQILSIPTLLKVSFDTDFLPEQKILSDFLKNYSTVQIKSVGATEALLKVKKQSGYKPESYLLKISKDGILIETSDQAGAFYALQTLKSLIDHKQWNKKTTTLKIPFAIIKDEPRFAYRGFMLDVARNFQSKEEIFRLLDVMAMYKLNKFHFHLIDDEGWRLEIPHLPELTAIGANRSASFNTGLSLQPAYGSGAKSLPNQYYTVSDYIEILKYAKERHIQVIPEVETPGHARAAIKAMRARYEKYKQQGNLQLAEEFLLDDADDKSVYNSAQNWNDNVMNPALPSTYHFLSTVIDQIKEMHQQAGTSLTVIDLGGDETPSGVWEKSPKIQAFMQQNNISNVLDVWPHYIAKINKLVQEKGLLLSGWEEIGMRNYGKGMDVNPDLAHENMLLNVWNNLPGGGQEDLAYRLANAGYKVVYTSANNNYLDITWDRNYSEPGHSWVGTTDIRRTYSFAPDNFFTNLRTNGDGESLKPEAYTNKVALTSTGKQNLIGIKGALWAEKITDKERLEEMIFPRLVAIADRAWSSESPWEQTQSFDAQNFEQHYASFMRKLGDDELKKLDILNGGYHYRFPSIGIKEEGNQLFINTDYPGYAVHYTDNGSIPDRNSKIVNKSIPFEQGKKYLFRVISGRRMSEVITY